MKQYTEEAKDEILELLREGETKVSFMKVNGDRRDMTCTLSGAIVPSPVVKEGAETKPERKENPDVQSVWDVNANGWRSFRWDLVVEYGTE